MASGITSGAFALVCALAALLLSACAPGAGGATSAATGPLSGTPVASAGMLKGVLHGGQSPIVGATVTLYGAGVPGTAGAAAPMLAQTITNSLGEFSFGNVTAGGLCSSSSALLYVVASGGSAGPSGSPNSAINLMAAVGACGSLPSYTLIDELTTVAAAYALNGFISLSSGTGGSGGSGVSGCVDCTPSAPTGAVNVVGSNPGLANAFATATLLADVTTGNPPSSAGSALPQASACAGGSAPINCAALQTLTGLANALAACVNSTTGSQCQELFTCAVPNATYQSGPPQSCTPPAGSTLPDDTLAATLLIARNPGLVSPEGIYTVPGAQVVFSPGLPAAPNDWTIALSTTVESAEGIAVDAAGDVWVATFEGNTLTELGPTGATLATFTVGGYPQNLAIDGAGNVWIASNNNGGVTEIPSSTGQPATIASGTYIGIAIEPNNNVWLANQNGSVTELNSSGVLSGAGFTGGGVILVSAEGEPPYGIAVDPSNHVWVTTPYYGAAGSLTEFNSVGVASTNSPLTGGGLTNPYGIAVDAGGNVWVTDLDSSSVTKLNGSGMQLWTSPSMTDGVNYPNGIAIDGAGTAWVAEGGGGVSVLASDGTPLTPNVALSGGELSYGISEIAIDPSGNVWATEPNSNRLTELIGAAAPVVTPLVAQITPSP